MDSFLKLTDGGVKALLFNKFKDAMELGDMNTDVVFFPKEVAQRRVAEKRGEGSIEFISFWRTATKFSWKRNTAPVARRGLLMEYIDPEGKTQFVNIKSVPVDLEYTVHLWSKDLEKLQKVAESYLFWQYRDPNLLMTFNDKYPLEMDLHFGEIGDEHTAGQAFDVGQYFVARIPLALDGWIFELASLKAILKIVVRFWEASATPPILLETMEVTA